MAEIETRLEREQDHYDRLSAEYHSLPRVTGSRLDRRYLMCERMNRLFDRIEASDGLQGRTVLSCGCGPGLYEVVMARRGAKVFAFDNSPGMLEVASRNARSNGVDIHFFQANEITLGTRIEELGIARIDMLFGASILHHLADAASLATAVNHRLAPDAIALFTEPIGGPIVSWARTSRLNPRRAYRTSDENPWTAGKYRAFLREIFHDVRLMDSLTLFSGLHNSGRGPKLLRKALDSRVVLELDSALRVIPGMSLLRWHAAFFASGPKVRSGKGTG